MPHRIYTADKCYIVIYVYFRRINEPIPILPYLYAFRGLRLSIFNDSCTDERTHIPRPGIFITILYLGHVFNDSFVFVRVFPDYIWM